MLGSMLDVENTKMNKLKLICLLKLQPRSNRNHQQVFVIIFDSTRIELQMSYYRNIEEGQLVLTKVGVSEMGWHLS